MFLVLSVQFLFKITAITVYDNFVQLFLRFQKQPQEVYSLVLRIFEAFVRILLIVNLSLNQTLLTFLFYVRQTWTAQLILAISL